MTEIGIIGAGNFARVGATGKVGGISASSIALDWWVGADDRWHRPSSEAAVRQGLGPDGVSVETRLRVPGGDVVHRAAAVPAAGSSVVVVEIFNDTPVPVAVSITLEAEQGGIDIYDDTVRVDGRNVLRAGRPVARAVAADTVDHLVATVEAGHAIPPSEADLPFHAQCAALIFPLPHKAVLKLVVDVGVGEGPGLPSPDRLPGLTDVGRGWLLHLDRATTVEVPDERVVTAVAAARRHLLLGAAQPVSASPRAPSFWSDATSPWAPAVSAVALWTWGHGDIARDLLLRATDSDHGPALARSPEVTASVMWAWAELLDGIREPELLSAIRPWVVESVGSLLGPPKRRRFLARKPCDDESLGWRALGLAAAAPVLTAVDEARSARDVVDVLPEIANNAAPGSVAAALAGHRLGVDGGARSLSAALLELCNDPGVEPTLGGVAALATPTGAMPGPARDHDPAASALLLLAVRRALVDEPVGPGGPVSLFAGIDRSWLGSPMEVQSAPIRSGSVDAAVRWHGDRPALLWDTHLDSGVELTAPSLDASWTDDRASGDALLAPTPSLTVEPGPESPRVRRGEDREPREDPGSFA